MLFLFFVFVVVVVAIIITIFVIVVVTRFPVSNRRIEKGSGVGNLAITTTIALITIITVKIITKIIEQQEKII